MERHPATSTVGTDKRHKGATAIGANPINAAFDRNMRERPGRGEPSPASGAARAWTHTLILTGELTHRSAHALELEIERLCDEGVTGITLDLRQLRQIDSIGVSVISFRCGLCQRQGFGFALIPGSPPIQRAFEQAGVRDLLPFQVDEVAARRLRTPSLRPTYTRRQ